MKNIFWGTSLSGKINLDFWISVNKLPDYFCCNDQCMWGTYFHDILVISPNELEKIIHKEDVYVYVTSYALTQIKEQLISLGLGESHVIRSQYPYHYFYENEYKYLLNKPLPKVQINRNKRLGYIFDLYGGTILAGSQTWVYAQQKILQDNGIEVSTILPSDVIYKKDLLKAPARVIERSKEHSFYDGCLSYLLSSDLNSFVNMDICESFVASCKAKEVLGYCFTNIVVVHADYEPYYCSFAQFEPYIDIYFVISEKIKQNLIKKGVPQNKLVKLDWSVNFKFNNRLYSSSNNPLQITYFGRLAVFQKRCDLLIPLVQKLDQLGVNFNLNIAGFGNYESVLKEKLSELNLDNHVKFYGEVLTCDVEDFLEKQDVFVNCSEFEGHSVSQYEAIACGCVPVITDVSGAVDDIDVGYNGFIVEKGDIDLMAQNIKKLDDDRSLLEIMELRGRMKVLKNNFKENALLKLSKDYKKCQK